MANGIRVTGVRVVVQVHGRLLGADRPGGLVEGPGVEAAVGEPVVQRAVDEERTPHRRPVHRACSPSRLRRSARRSRRPPGAAGHRAWRPGRCRLSSMISMPLISGFSVTWRRSMSTVPSLVTGERPHRPALVPPAAATMSKLSSTVVPSIATLNTRCRAVEVPSYWFAKYSRTVTGLPAVHREAIPVAAEPSSARCRRCPEGCRRAQWRRRAQMRPSRRCCRR